MYSERSVGISHKPAVRFFFITFMTSILGMVSVYTENDQMSVKSAIDQALENNKNCKIEHSIILNNGDIRQIQEIGEFKAVKMERGHGYHRL